MTTPPGLPPRPPVTARPGRLQRWKLTQPARLYGYTILAALSLVLVAAGVTTGEMGHALTGLAAAVLGIVPATETIRASVYSPASNLRTLVTARQQWDAGNVFDQAASL